MSGTPDHDDGLVVQIPGGGHIALRKITLSSPTAWFSRVKGGTKWRILVSDGENALLQSETGRVSDNYHEFWTARDALEHFEPRTDAWAALATAAIRENML